MPEDAIKTNDDLLVKQVEPLFRATLSGGLANIFAAVLVFALLAETHHKESALWFSVFIILLSVIRIAVSNSYLNKIESGNKNKHKFNIYLNTHTFLTFLIGIGWGLCLYIQHQPSDEAVRNIAFLINFGLIAGSITTLSTYRIAYISYVMPQLIAIIAVFLIIGTQTSYYLAITTLLATVFMVAASFSINRSHKNEIRLAYNNKQLISDLNTEIKVRKRVQNELEKSKRGLEIKVEERTRDLVNINANLERVIDKKEQAEQTLQYLAYHDELTGMPNRNTLVDRIGQSIKKSSREKQQMAILFFDLDRFKNVNDSLGHAVGDELLQEVASRLYSSLRNNDTISRNGGDEFVVVLEELSDTNEAVHVAKKIIKCITETFEIKSHKIHLGVSVGISIYPTDGETPLVLLRNADTAMYRAKKAGGNQLQFYDESMSRQLRNRLELEHELHDALLDEEFYMQYQPQISCISGVTTGFEALMRWKNKKYGEILPDRFIPIMEETGLIYSVGQWVVSQVIDFISINHIQGITFSINLSALQCNDLSFVDFVRERIEQSGIDPSQIEFEITESLLVKDFEKTKSLLDEMHKIGCTIALDDFGTGYTSMSYLARLPIDIIKVDKTLVHNIDVSNNLKSIVKAIVTMSDGLGIKNIFEGVETMAELAVIKRMGGEIIQGFLFSKPLDSENAIKWLDAGEKAKQA
jgi:diguanylate cyclase (GGDEF)-like protein